MKYKEFLQTIETEIKKKLEDGYSLKIHPVKKNNGKIYDGLLIINPSFNIAPAIYLNPYYHWYLDGVSINDIVDSIISSYKEVLPKQNFDITSVYDYSLAKSHIIMKLVNYEQNKNELMSMPHVKYLDLAVSKAVETGINQYAIYDSKLHAMYLRKQAIAKYISTALENHELEIRFRPTYNTKENRFVRAEYYMRMFVKDIGMVGSAEFVPIAEDTGQISSVEYYALEQVAREIAELEKQGIAYESIAVPVSPVLLIQENFVDTVQSMIEKYQIPSGKLAVEIDEYALTTTPVIIEIVMQQLKDLGVELILNNFGSGYSGISKILELPVDTLKFERMFMWQLETNQKSEPIVECLIKAADKLGKRLIAEGVETQRQLDILAKFGCEYQQGYYYAPTIPKELLADVLGKSMDETRTVLDQEREKLKR